MLMKCVDSTTPCFVRRALVLVCVSLSACTSQPLVGQYLPAGASCCEKLTDYSFTSLALGKEAEFSFTQATPTLTIGGRRGHFVGFSVPSGLVVTSAAVKTYLSTDFLPKATAVAPELHFYDEHFHSLGGAAIANLQSDKGFWRGSVSGRVAVPGNTRYIVVMASTGEAGRAIVRSDNGTPYRLPPAALGEMSIRLYGEAPAR